MYKKTVPLLQEKKVMLRAGESSKITKVIPYTTSSCNLYFRMFQGYKK